ncbi:permease-like cell division protein FtsX [Tersicoccus sp. MR15.9]|uniref:permease-like cell division protein FtsX n=1 Tax=Tersicoccus mangrovi TaxID=3121635 RepID=UPI002FE50C94
MRAAFILGEIGHGLRRNLTMVVSIVLVTFVSLTFVGAAALLQMQINQMKGYWYDKVEISLFLCQQGSVSPTCASGAVTEQQREAIAAQLQSPTFAPYVASAHFESSAEAFTHFKEQFKNSPIVDTVTADQLPSSFRIQLKDPTKFDVIREGFSSTPGVDTVNDQRELLEPLFSKLNQASVFALVTAGIMIVCAVLLIATTIRLSAFSRRRETGIMRLVGASKSVIQLPFVLEGIIAATIGSVLASAALWSFTRFYVEDYLSRESQDLAFISSNDALLVAPALIVLGIVLSGASSVLTLRRYLKV